MNIEDYRDYCLSLGKDVEEKLPFTAFRYASGVLAFYVHGHMFAFFDCDDFGAFGFYEVWFGPGMHRPKFKPNIVDFLTGKLLEMENGL